MYVNLGNFEVTIECAQSV